MKNVKVKQIVIVSAIVLLALTILVVAYILPADDSGESQTELTEVAVPIDSVVDTESIESSTYMDSSTEITDVSEGYIKIRDYVTKLDNPLLIIDESSWHIDEDTVTVQLVNTDAVMMWISQSPDIVDGPSNLYGSDFPIVVWQDGIPDDNVLIYETFYDRDDYMFDIVYTGVVNGSIVTLTPINSTESITFDYEEVTSE